MISFIERSSLPASAEAVPLFSSRGPRAASRWLDILIALSTADLRVRYGRGGFRLVKWLIDPFLLVGVYLVLVTLVLDRPGEAPGLSVACAVIPFQLVLLSAFSAIASVHGRQNIILNMGFNRMLIPVASVVTETIAFGAGFLLLVMMLAIYSIGPTVALFWLPVVLLVCIAFAVSLAYPISLFGIWLPQLRSLAGSVIRTLFFLSPGLVALAEIHGRTHDLLKLNPLTGLFEAFRSIFLYGHRPAAWQLLYPSLFAVIALILFVPIYRREEPQFAKIVEME